MNRVARRLFATCLGWTLLIVGPGAGQAQSPFVLDNDYDGERVHGLRLWALDSQANAIDGAVEAPFELAHFKLRVITGSGAPIANAPGCHLVGFKVNLNGNWYTVGNNSDVIISTTFVQPPNGISRILVIEYEATISTIQGNRTRSGYLQPVTIYASNSYHDSEGNTFAQMRRQVTDARIPILVVEGLDPQNSTYPPALFGALSPLANDQLYPNGYEVFVLNFKDGGADLRENAAVLTHALAKVRALCPQHGIALVGLSMGGVVGRYALVKEEALGHDHGVGVFVSYDSPQQIANINTQFQSQIRTLVSTDIGGQAALEKFRAALRCRAAKQLLEFNTYDPYHSARDSFQTEIHGLSSDGYPHKCNVYGISNGTLQPTWDRGLLEEPLVDFGVAGHPIFQVTMEKRDVGPGSMYINLAQRRFGSLFGDIAPWLPFDISWNLTIHRNPVFIPTQSALDFQVVQMADEAAPITGWSGTPFREILYQTQPLLHDGFSAASAGKLLEWLAALTPVTVNYASIDGAAITPDVVNVGLVKATTVTVNPKTIVMSDGRSVTFKASRWDDGVVANPRSLFAPVGASHTVDMKGVLASSVSGATWASSQRRAIIETDGTGRTAHGVYESGGSIWHVRNRRGAGWEPERRLSVGAGAASSPAIATYSFGHEDQIQVFVAWLEPDGAMRYRASNADNAVTWQAPVSIFSVEPSPPLLPDESCIVWTEGPNGDMGIYYFKQPLTNQYDPLLIAGTEGGTDPAICASSGCRYQLAFIKVGKLYVVGLNDAYPLNGSAAPQVCATAYDGLAASGWTPSSPSIVSGGGNVQVAWVESNGTTTRLAFSQKSGTSWSSPVYFTHSTHQISKPVLSVDATHGVLNMMAQCGDHVALWSRPLAGSVWGGRADLGQGKAPTMVEGESSAPEALWTSGNAAPYSVNIARLEDSASPSAVPNMGVQVISSSELWVSWSAPSIAGYATATEYDLRMSLATITEANFASATPLSIGSPGSPGSGQEASASDLYAHTRYYFALKSKSASGKWSSISNVANGRTLVQSEGEFAVSGGTPGSMQGSGTALAGQSPASATGSGPVGTRFELHWDADSEPRQLRLVGIAESAGTDSVAVKRTLGGNEAADTLSIGAPAEATIALALRGRDELMRFGRTWHPTLLATLVHTQGEEARALAVSRVSHVSGGIAVDVDSVSWAGAPTLCGIGDTLIIEYREVEAEPESIGDGWLVLQGDPTQTPWSAASGAGVPAPARNATRLGIRWLGAANGTRFELRLPQAGVAKVEIIDLSGRRVSALAPRSLAAGTHVIEWDGLASSGAPLSRGIYLCRVLVGSASAVTKLVR